MDLERVVENIADGLKHIDGSGVAFKHFQPGIGPYGEPQLVNLVATYLNSIPRYGNTVKTMRTPDLLICGHWALEIKLARPFGDNGKLAENWSVNLLHPYHGNTSLLGDCLKLQSLNCEEQKGVIAIGYEHDPPQVSLEPLLDSFEVVARQVLHIQLGRRTEARRSALVHPVHQQLVVAGWKID
jgi:hypothetical protein